MRISPVLASIGCLLIPSSQSLRILLSNDDGWSSANVREMYKALKASGHEVVLVAPVTDQSGTGGSLGFSRSSSLVRQGEFNSVSTGAAAYGYDSHDSRIWYYDGTPAATTFFALDFAIPNSQPFGPGVMPDLFVAGPNEGNNVGPFMFTQSGTIGATYAAISRGIPGIAFSAGDSNHRSHMSVAGSQDVATLNARVATMFVNQVANVMSDGHKNIARTFPAGYGVSINLPSLGPHCNNPAFSHARLTGGVSGIKAMYDPSTSTFYPQEDSSMGNILNTCINGECSLPGEANVIRECGASVTSFTIDYDAPNCRSPTFMRAFLNQTVTAVNDQVAGEL